MGLFAGCNSFLGHSDTPLQKEPNKAWLFLFLTLTRASRGGRGCSAGFLGTRGLPALPPAALGGAAFRAAGWVCFFVFAMLFLAEMSNLLSFKILSFPLKEPTRFDQLPPFPLKLAEGPFPREELGQAGVQLGRGCAQVGWGRSPGARAGRGGLPAHSAPPGCLVRSLLYCVPSRQTWLSLRSHSLEGLFPSVLTMSCVGPGGISREGQQLCPQLPGGLGWNFSVRLWGANDRGAHAP